MQSPRTRPLDDEDISGGLCAIQRFRDRVVRDQVKRKRGPKAEPGLKPDLSAEEAFNLLVLVFRARKDGSLRGKREGRKAWWDEEQLASFLRVSEPTFRRRWYELERKGWVRTVTPPDRRRLERWLVAEDEEK